MFFLEKRNVQALKEMIKSPTKLSNFLRATLFKKKRGGSVRYLPYTMDIEPTTVCNFRCTMCQVSDSDWIQNHMPLEFFQQVIDDNPQLLKIKLQGLGEPFANKNIFAMVEYAAERGIVVETTTNGSFLNDRIIDNIIKSSLSKMEISIDGATKHTFEKIRRGSNFDQVISNAHNFIHAIKRHRKPIDVHAWTVLQKDNLHEAVNIVTLCKNIGFHKLTFQITLSGWGKPEWELTSTEKSIDYDKNKEILNIATDTARKLGLPFQVYTENQLNFQKLCNWPWHSVFVSAKGNVVPCCIIGDDRVKSFGSLKTQKLWEIWNSDEYQEFRHEHLQRKIPSFCQGCYSEYEK